MQALLGKTLPRTFSALLNSQKSKLAEFLTRSTAAVNTPIYNNTQTIETSLHEPLSVPPSNKDIKLLSYNIFVRPPLIHNNGNDFKDERLQEFMKVSQNYDIICLQEMFGAWSDRKDKLIEKTREAGFLYHATTAKPPTLSHLLIDGGLLILSKYPIENSEFCPYPYGIGSDFYVEKGVLYVKVKVGNAKLHLYTTHAQATYDGSLKYFLKRTEQFNTLQGFTQDTLIRNEYNDNDLVLLTGDFNVNARDAQRFQGDNTELNRVFQKFDKLVKKGSYSEYDALVNCLTNNTEDEVEDLLYKSYGEHPITFGDYFVTADNQKKPRESALTHKSCLCAAETLDYIFKYVPKGLSSGRTRSSKQSLAIKNNSAAVERFMTFGQQFGQLSDHYGVRVTLQHKQDIADTVEAAANSYINEHAVQTN